jgi:hypothetical protein
MTFFLTGIFRVGFVLIILLRHDVVWSHALLIVEIYGQMSGHLIVDDGFDRLIRVQFAEVI